MYCWQNDEKLDVSEEKFCRFDKTLCNDIFLSVIVTVITYIMPFQEHSICDIVSENIATTGY